MQVCLVNYHFVAGLITMYAVPILLMKGRAEGNIVLLTLGLLSITEVRGCLVVFSYIYVLHITCMAIRLWHLYRQTIGLY